MSLEAAFILVLLVML